MAEPPVNIAVRVDGLRALQSRIRKLPKTAQAEVKTAVQEVADDEAARTRAAGARAGALASLAASSIKSRRGNAPAIVAGGARRLGSEGGRAGDLFFGAEFGGQRRPTTQQFQPWRGTEGYWFWPQLREDQDRIMARYEGVVEAIAREWER